ncbi:MAG TPA: hypothetical protein PK559_02170 [Ignavibacteriaceae bacterium]|nr:hypothetical protein [Ignavibacteriaceae bacterium]
MKRILITLTAFIVIIFTGCTDSITTSTVTTADGTLSVSLNNLPQLSDSSNYAIWLFGKDSVKLDYFKVTNDGANFSKTYNVKLGHVQGAKYLAITVEHDSSALNDSISRGRRFLAGIFSANNATLSVKTDIAFNNDFNSVVGKYTLFTPTDTANTQKKSGIWFVKNVDAPPIQAGLELPTLPSGWEYNAWVEVGSVKLKTGGFRSVSGKDNDSTYCGPLAALAFPGEDFLNNAPAGVTFPVDLSGKSVYITVQPTDWKLNRPFNFEVLRATIPSPASENTAYDLQKNLVLPSGSGVVVF